LAISAEDLETEQVFPLATAGVQPCHLPLRGFEQREAIIFDRHIPEERADVAADLSEIAGEPARQVDQMHALVEHLAAAGDRWVGAPLALVAQPPAVAVAPANIHERPKHATVEDRARLLEGRVEAMVEANLDDDAGGLGGGDQRAQLVGIARGRLLDQYVL